MEDDVNNVSNIAPILKRIYPSKPLVKKPKDELHSRLRKALNRLIKRKVKY